MRKKKQITCKVAQGLIDDYLNYKIADDKVGVFVAHIDSCSECMDELEVRFLVKEGLASLEEGESFDLKADLSRRLSHSRRLVLIASRAKMALVITSIVLSAVLAGVVFGVFIF